MILMGMALKHISLSRAYQRIPQGIITEIFKYYLEHFKAIITTILASAIGVKL